MFLEQQMEPRFLATRKDMFTVIHTFF